jgi:hypothetical protein
MEFFEDNPTILSNYALQKGATKEDQYLWYGPAKLHEVFAAIQVDDVETVSRRLEGLATGLDINKEISVPRFVLLVSIHSRS